ncbi:MAG: DNA-directed RNA polymerase subunit omega [Acidobacteria bacterium]|nr:DNA-directed RNA polymerase subunit omega [Acidobacteriota bacterium]
MAHNHDDDLKHSSIDSKYRKILIAAKRSKQIQKGARPRLNLPDSKPTRVALEEVENGLVNFEVTQMLEK